jgi:hypothetical protein
VDLLIAIITLALLGLAIAIISGPLRAERRSARGAGERASEPVDRAELEAAREAKYREIRDAELDYRTGKLSDADFGAIDAELRAEALVILNRLEQLDREGVQQRGRPAGADGAHERDDG